ncbi:hypothetical protein B0H17DRAFT_1145197 [Mycena rosella]|uniref:Uncharacterized protein n=1 Tax=Mycena rosella TaxID=1033263 RepID=A0AAD7G2K8_MYCRO|nr:hypothetical protein B0H17DRAFT_1145197 [Mycena rosella]
MPIDGDGLLSGFLAAATDIETMASDIESEGDLRQTLADRCRASQQAQVFRQLHAQFNPYDKLVGHGYAGFIDKEGRYSLTPVAVLPSNFRVVEHENCLGLLIQK